MSPKRSRRRQKNGQWRKRLRCAKVDAMFQKIVFQETAKKKAAGSSRGGASSFVDLVADKFYKKWGKKDKEQQSYIELKNRELSIREADAREIAQLKREKLEIQRRTLELAEREKRDRDILFYNSAIDTTLPPIQQEKLLEMKMFIMSPHSGKKSPVGRRREKADVAPKSTAIARLRRDDKAYSSDDKQHNQRFVLISERLVAAYFTDSPMYNEKRFRQTFRMARLLFNQIVNAVTTHSAYFQCNPDCAGREGISPLIKCTSAIRQLAYGVNASFLDEYMQISERSSRMALDHFCQAVMEIYGPEFLRKPTVTDVEKLYRHHEEKQGFSGISRSAHDLWIWHAFLCVAGSNNTINVLNQPLYLNDLKTGRAPEIPFVANGVNYPSGYYLVDGIYPELAPLVKTIPEPADDDHKRILYKQKQESARKDVERAFGVLKKKWAILVNPHER
ncbi:ALP1-like protein [Tanacetum coccineum]